MRTQFIALLFLTMTACGQTKENMQKKLSSSSSDTILTNMTSMTDYSPIIDKAHPNAKRLMNEEFYFSPIDETGPFGNDDGADTYGGFQQWRKANKNSDPKEYLIEQLTEWGYSTFDLNETRFEKLEGYLKDSPIGSRLLTGTDAAIIAIAFGQLYLEGAIDKSFKEIAKTAIKRELVPEILLLWGTPYGIKELKPKPNDPGIVERETKLKKMLVVLNQAE